jgi:hypothetical protein
MPASFTLPAPPPKVADQPTYAAVVAQIGERVWGRNWPSGMGRLLGRSARNLQRLRDAARDGQDYRTAPEILNQVHALLGDVVAATAPWTKG